MDDEVAIGEHGAVAVAEPEPVTADVAGDRDDPPLAHRVERLGAAGRCGRRPEPVERVVLEQLLAHPFGGRGALAVADEQYERALGHAAQQPLDERRADETGGPGDGDALPRERRSDHAVMSSTSAVVSLPNGREVRW